MSNPLLDAERAALVEAVGANGNVGAKCPLCYHRVRDDSKNLDRWMAAALKSVYDYTLANPDKPAVNLGKLVKDGDGSRGHNGALLRHWGLLLPVERPEYALPSEKGSRGLSGFYIITELGKEFVEGKIKMLNKVQRPFGEKNAKYVMCGYPITFEEALKTKLVAINHIVKDGTTYE